MEEKMTPEHQRCKEYLQTRRGKELIASAGHISLLLGIPERRIRTIVRDLRRDGCPIGSSMGNPSGYWWATRPEELVDTIKSLRALATDMLVTQRAMERCYMTFGGQLELLDP